MNQSSRVTCTRSRSIGRVGRGRDTFAPRDLGLDQRQQRSPIPDGIFVGPETADQDMRDPGVVVVEDGRGHILPLDRSTLAKYTLSVNFMDIYEGGNNLATTI